MAVQRASRNAFAAVSVALALGVLVVANLLADRAFYRVDLTAEGRYSLSPPFRQILSRLESPLKLTYYSSEKVVAEFETGKRDILDKLREIETAAQGQVVLEVLDPAQDPALEKKLLEEFPDIVSNLRSIEKDKATVTRFYTAPRLTYQNKKPIQYPPVYSAEDLEYLIGSGILSLTQKERALIAAYAPKPLKRGSMSTTPRDDYEWLFLPDPSRRFAVQRVDFSEGSGIPDKARLLVVVRPKSLSERARYEIVRYLAQGGTVFFLWSPWEIDLEYLNLEHVKSGMEEYLQGLGVEWVPALVCDESNAPLPKIRRKQAQEFLELEPHPFFVRILPQNLDTSCPITRFLPSLVMPYTSAFVLAQEKVEALNLSLEILAKTSGHSWTEPVGAFLDISRPLKPPAKYDSPRPVFLRLTGKFPFPWAGQAPPPWPSPEARDGKGAGKPAEPEPIRAFQPGEGRLYLFPCPESFHGAYLFDWKNQETFKHNFKVFLNVFESTLGDELVQIRTKQYETRGIQKFEGKGGEVTRNALKIALVGLVALAVMLIGGAYGLVRRDAQIRHERAFASTTGPSSFSP